MVEGFLLSTRPTGEPFTTTWTQSMIAVDTNVLVYAHRKEFPQHGVAVVALADLAEGRALWALPVFVLGEFLRVVTNHRFLDPPSDVATAVSFLDGVLASPTVRVIGPGPRYWPLLRDFVVAAKAIGYLVFDAQIAAVCAEHGVDTIVSDDRDLRRFPGPRVRGLPSSPG